MDNKKKILEGIIDLHIHAGPSLAERKLDGGDMAKIALDYGYKAFVIKDHYFPTTFSAKLCEDHIGDKRVRVFGGIALNNSVGGLNLKAVDSAYNMGAKFVYMPTVSARCHIESHRGHHFPGAGKGTGVAEKEIYYLDEKGNLDPAVVQILEYIVRRNDLILATGHGTRQEIDKLIEKAVELGVDKIYVNHPFYMINADMELMKKWADMGAYIEINACVFLFGEHPTPFTIAEEIFKQIDRDKIVISSDLGQPKNSMPHDGMFDFLQILQTQYGITDQQIYTATRTNPAKLLGI